MSKFRLYESHRDIYQIQEWAYRPPTTYKPGVINEGTWNWNTIEVLNKTNRIYAKRRFKKVVNGLIAARNFVPQVIEEMEIDDEI